MAAVDRLKKHDPKVHALILGHANMQDAVVDGLKHLLMRTRAHRADHLGPTCVEFHQTVLTLCTLARSIPPSRFAALLDDQSGPWMELMIDLLNSYSVQALHERRLPLLHCREIKNRLIPR